MAVRRGMAAVVAVAGGLSAMGADPAPPLPVPPSPQDRAAYMAKVLPAPRLYEISNTIDGRPGPTGEACLSAESVMRQTEAVRARAAGRNPTAGQGCTHTSRLLAGGGMHMEIACDKAAGASRTSRSTLDSDGHLGLRQHVEAQVDGPRGPRTLVSDARIEPLGACPADLKPGELRMADGRKVDLAAALARRREPRADAAK